MKSILIFLLLSFTPALHAQQEAPSKKPQDSVRTKGIESTTKRFLGFEWGLAGTPGLAGKQLYARKLRLGEDPFIIPPANSPQNILLPLLEKYREQKKLAPYYYVLSMLRDGFACFLLYRHLHKYDYLY